MAVNLLDLALPGLGSALSVLGSLHAKYKELKEGRELCTSLHQRLTDFAHELEKIPPATLQSEELLRRLQSLVNEYETTVTTFAAQRNFVKRVLKMDKFSEDIKTYNERLDSIIAMITVGHTEKLVELLRWRAQYEEDAAGMVSQLTKLTNVQREIWVAMQNMATKRDIEDLAMLAKRDVAADTDPTRTSQPLDPVRRNIVQIAEKDFLGGKSVETPPTWLIAADEVSTVGPPIDSEGLTFIFVGEWQGAQVAVKKFDAIGESLVVNKHFAVWRSLLHPHVAQLYGAGSDDGAPFFVYEYASRQSLDRCWGQLAPAETWRLLRQAALGLAYLHKKHVVHGNLSCSKLLVNDQGHVKLYGFGASFFQVDNKSNSVKVETREDFAAPECIGIGPNGERRGDRHGPRFEADVYSFGLTIVEAVTTKDPFAGMSPKDIRARKASGQLLKPAEMSDDAWTLVTQMCVRDPSQRVSLAYVVEQLDRLAHRMAPSA